MLGTRNLYVYTPGFPRRQGRSKLLNMLVLGEFPRYKMIVENGAVHMVHNRYHQYVVKVNYRYNGPYDIKVFHKKQDANEYIQLCIIRYPSALVEYVTADWKNTLIDYGWYKHFSYSRFGLVKPTLKDSQDTMEQPIDHPLEKYLYSEYDTLSRIDADSNIEWSIEGGIEGEEDETEDNAEVETENIIKMLSQFV